MLAISIESPEAMLRSQRVDRMPCTIGRASDSDVVLAGWRVGRLHARIERTDAGFRLIDCGTLSGTLVNGDRVQEYGPLLESDEIFIAGHRLRLLHGLSVPSESNLQSGSDTLPNLQSVPTASATAGQTHLATAATSIELFWQRLLHRRLLEQIDIRQRNLRQWTDAQLRGECCAILADILSSEPDFPESVEKEQLIRTIVDEAVGLGPLQALLSDDHVSEIMVNGTNLIHIERDGQIERTDRSFSSDEAIRLVIERIITPLGRHIDESSPMVDARLPDGSRLNAIIPPLSPRGPAITIRRFNRRIVHPDDLIKRGCASAEMVDFLRCCVERRLNVVVSGGTGSGKTTLLNLLSGFVPAGERIITIEDAAELKLQHENLVTLESRPANPEGRGLVTTRDLVRNALRMRPDRIIVGECRSSEALDMLQAMNTGHDGSLTTVHANSARDALSRIEIMALMAGIELPIQALREQIASAIQIIVHQARGSDGTRRIVEITEVAGMEGSRILLHPLFSWRCASDSSAAFFEASGHAPPHAVLSPQGRYASGVRTGWSHG